MATDGPHSSPIPLAPLCKPLPFERLPDVRSLQRSLAATALCWWSTRCSTALAGAGMQFPFVISVALEESSCVRHGSLYSHP
jgi:hypothetical protein